MTQSSIVNYDLIVKEIKDKYESIPGIIEVQPADFFDDEVILVIDKDFLKIEMPYSYKNIRLTTFDIYENYKHISIFLDELIINEFSLWEHPNDTAINYLFSLCDSYKKIISTYEKNKKYKDFI